MNDWSAFPGYPESIAYSRRILEWDDDWDDEGAVHYEEATWDKAEAVLYRMVTAFCARDPRCVPVIRIAPGPDGTIDLTWHDDNRDRSLLINVPATDTEPMNYYGRLGRDHRAITTATVEGTLNPANTNDWLLTWLLQEGAVE